MGLSRRRRSLSRVSFFHPLLTFGWNVCFGPRSDIHRRMKLRTTSLWFERVLPAKQEGSRRG